MYNILNEPLIPWCVPNDINQLALQYKTFIDYNILHECVFEFYPKWFVVNSSYTFLWVHALLKNWSHEYKSRKILYIWMYLKFIAKDLNIQIKVFRSVGRLNPIFSFALHHGNSLEFSNKCDLWLSHDCFSK